MLSEPTGQATTEVLCTAKHFPQGCLETRRALFTLENLLTEEAQAGLWALASLRWGLLPSQLWWYLAALAWLWMLDWPVDASSCPTHPCVQENTWLGQWQCTDGFPSQYYAGSLGLWFKIYDVFNEIWDSSALGSWKLSMGRQKHLILTRHSEG